MTWMSPNHYRTIDNVQRPLAESFGKVPPAVLVLGKPVRIERRMVRALVMVELGATATVCAVMVLAAAFLMRAGDVAPAGRSLALPDRALLTLGLLAMIALMIEGAVTDWSGTLLAQGGADIRSTTVGYGAFSYAMAGGRLWGDWLVGRFGAATIVRCGGVLAAAGLALVAWVPTPLAGAAAAMSILAARNGVFAPRVCHES
jgi:hypothetical protein